MRKAIIAGAIGLAFMAGWTAHGDKEGPRLIAQGCANAGGDIWVAEESDLPVMCDHVERWQ